MKGYNYVSEIQRGLKHFECIKWCNIVSFYNMEFAFINYKGCNMTCPGLPPFWLQSVDKKWIDQSLFHHIH